MHPTWKKEVADKQQAEQEKVKTQQKAELNTHKAREKDAETPVESTTIGNIAQTAYLAAHGHDIPQNFREATTGADADYWWKAMEEEITLLKKRGMWKLVDKPKDRKVVGCRWTYVIKYGSNSEILRYKARLVAQGYSQIPGLNFSDTYSPTVLLDSIRAILHLATAHGWSVAKTMSPAHFCTARSTTIYISANPKALTMTWTKSPSF